MCVYLFFKFVLKHLVPKKVSFWNWYRNNGLDLLHTGLSSWLLQLKQFK